MKFRFHFFTLLLLLCTTLCSAQKFTISGIIEDAKTGEKLIGANIYAPILKNGTSTNVYGFYSLTLPADSIELVFSYIGYVPKAVKILLAKDEKIDLQLSPSIELQTVIVSDSKTEKIEESSQMSSIEIPIKQIKSIPALMGEVDVLKVLQLLPGVQSGGEGTSGLYVRGGGPDQNLILLDGAPVYNVTHLFGFFSVFNADAINNVQLTKGGFPARYGGRLSSVIDINMKEGNLKKFSGEASVGLVAAKLTLEAPIVKDRTSFIISGRRTYIDALAAPVIKAAADGAGSGGYYFYDLNAKINHKINDDNRIYLSAYSGDDKFHVKAEDKYNGTTSTNNYKLGWGNITSSFRWNSIINSKLFSNVMATYSRFRFYVSIEQEEDDGTNTDSFFLRYLSGINDWTGKVDFDYVPNPNHYIKFGTGGIYHTFNTGATQFKIEDGGSTPVDTSLGADKLHAGEFSVYIEDDIRFTPKLKANLGVHASSFLVNGKFYYSIQPRVSARYLFNETWSVKASYAQMAQFIHLLTNSNVGLPTDLWVPSTDRIKPQTSQQVALGFARTQTIKDADYEFSIEGYYKWMNNIVDYAEGANFLFSNGTDWQSKIEQGKGWAYGAEFFIQKKTGKTTGWVGYTLSWTNRQFTNINQGNVYPYKYDRRHDISVVVSHQFGRGIELSGTWVYGTGNAITMPLAVYAGYTPQEYGYNPWNTNTLQYYGSKNSYRMRSYHRFDIGVDFKKKTKWGERSWIVSVYNAYNRKNPYFLYFGTDEYGNRQARQVSLFPIIPSVAYRAKF